MIKLLLLAAIATLATCAQQEGWWTASLGVQISDFNEFKTLLTTDYKDKVVIADFYMQNCHWCQVFQADWNKIVKDFTDSFEGKVVFIKVDGPNSRQLTDFLQLNSYPSFVKWQPSSNGAGSIYQGNRTYDAMKEWILVGTNNAGFTPREGGPISAGLWQQQSSKKTNSSTVKVAAGGDSSELAEIAKFTAEEVHKLSSRTQQLLDLAEKQHTPSDFNYLVYFMLGIIGGAVAAMVFVTYLIKIGKFDRRMKGRPTMRRGSENSTAEENEECSEDKYV